MYLFMTCNVICFFLSNAKLMKGSINFLFSYFIKFLVYYVWEEEIKFLYNIIFVKVKIYLQIINNKWFNTHLGGIVIHNTLIAKI